ncbi:MAG: ABC transporter substrate-binding protein [Deltaproteobacteria bacterium]|nr:ABC transporter substrate-binding protein [Deltaproteobacteria bacterium]
MGRPLLLLSLVLVWATLAGCQRSRSPDAPLRLGYFPNLTHAQALVGDAEGTFAKALEPRKIEVKRFNAGPSAMEALLAGELDVTYVGTSPVINAFVRSKGAVHVVAGAASGGAELIVKDARGPADLRGKRVASPQLGNTQDIALRFWLRSHGLSTSTAGGGDVTIVPVPNPDILTLFQRGELAGAWVPEPWGARLIAEGGGHILVDERELWPKGAFATTVLAASSQALKVRRADVRAILSAHVALTERGRADPRRFAQEANAGFAHITGRALPEPILQDAFSRIELTADPMQRQLSVAAQHAAELGCLPRGDVTGRVDSTILDEVVSSRSAPP